MQTRLRTYFATKIATAILVFYIALASWIIFICCTVFPALQISDPVTCAILYLGIMSTGIMLVWQMDQIHVAIALREFTEWDNEALQWKLKYD